MLWTEEMHGSDRDPDLKMITSEPLVGMAIFSTRAKWRSSLSACSSVEKKGKKVLDREWRCKRGDITTVCQCAKVEVGADPRT